MEAESCGFLAAESAMSIAPWSMIIAVIILSIIIIIINMVIIIIIIIIATINTIIVVIIDINIPELNLADR